jgi:hypothetical protein
VELREVPFQLRASLRRRGNKERKKNRAEGLQCLPLSCLCHRLGAPVCIGCLHAIGPPPSPTQWTPETRGKWPAETLAIASFLHGGRRWYLKIVSAQAVGELG